MSERLPLEGTLRKYAAESRIYKSWNVIAALAWSVLLLVLVGQFSRVLVVLAAALQPATAILAQLGLSFPSHARSALAFAWLMVGLSTQFSVMGYLLLTCWIAIFPFKVWSDIKQLFNPTQESVESIDLPWKSSPRGLWKKKTSRFFRHGNSEASLQLTFIFWLLFGESTSLAAFAIATSLGFWLIIVCAFRVFERTTTTLYESMLGAGRLIVYGLALLSIRSHDGAFQSDKREEVLRRLRFAQSFSTWVRRLLVWARVQLDSSHAHRWAALIAIVDAGYWFSGLLFSAVFFWAGWFGIVERGCSASLTTWIQVAASSFLRVETPGFACTTGWRAVCAVSLWLVLALLIAPAASKIGDRQKKLNDILIELRSTLRIFVTSMRTQQRRVDDLILSIEGRTK